MKKLVYGIVDFQKHVLPSYRETFRRLALEQKPDALFIACSDSRVVPNLFASSDPGDLFVIRNVGNLIPPCGLEGHSGSDESEFAAIEFAILNLGVKDIIVCGHSDCGAMIALHSGREKVAAPHLRGWLRHGEGALETLKNGKLLAHAHLAEHNRLSQLNVLQQMKHLETYSLVSERVQAGTLRIHGWWFDIGGADVHAWDADSGKFIRIDEAVAKRISDAIDGSAEKKSPEAEKSRPGLTLTLEVEMARAESRRGLEDR